MELRYIWTNGKNPDFEKMSDEIEDYFNNLVGAHNRISFMPHNTLEKINDVIMVYDGDAPVACAGIRRYSDVEAEVKRVYVKETYRGNGISSRLMKGLEERAADKGYKRLLLQTRKECNDAIGLYSSKGYVRVDNYPPYDTLPQAICYSKNI